MLIVDSRERALINMLTNKNIQFEVRTLILGDIICEDILFERKTISDLSSSICDGRFEQQRARLREYKGRVGFIIEGAPSSTLLNGGVASAIASLALEFILIPSADVETTAIVLSKILRRTTSNITSKEAQMKELVAKHKITSYTPKEFLNVVLMMIPQIGKIKAQKISEKFKSLEDFIHNYTSGPISEKDKTKIKDLLFHQ